MSRVAIVTDTTVTIPEDLVRNYDIQLVPLVFHLDNQHYQYSIAINTTDELVQLVKKTEQLPHHLSSITR